MLVNSKLDFSLLGDKICLKGQAWAGKSALLAYTLSGIEKYTDWYIDKFPSDLQILPSCALAKKVDDYSFPIGSFLIDYYLMRVFNMINTDSWC